MTCAWRMHVCRRCTWRHNNMTGGFHSHRDTPHFKWMVYVMENPLKMNDLGIGIEKFDVLHPIFRCMKEFWEFNDVLQRPYSI